MVTKEQRRSIVDALLALLEERGWEEIGLDDVARQAGISLADLRAGFDGKMAILEAFVREIDAEVLAEDVSDMADEPPRERLFDVLMRRLDALVPHKAALRGLAASARRDPTLAAGLNKIAFVSQRWMLTAAGIRIEGLLGAAATEGLVVAFARVMRVFLTEDDPGMPRTMAALDKELRRSEQIFVRLERATRLFRRPPRRPMRRPDREAPEESDPPAAPV
ncbi:TetR family transcriptional regulator [Amorphus sp. 3PC139-8]|uniref:TetR family transcriptional regulator n=1 Tax=Amorphus sp. 3PC139-8 TaxID=2735676 RepID=UPI00345CA858